MKRHVSFVLAATLAAVLQAPARAADPGTAAAAEAAPAAAPAPAPAPVIRRKVPVAAKVSAGQLFMRLDSIDRRLDELQKAAVAKPSAMAAPVIVAPKPGGVVETDLRDLNEAFYNYGVNHKKAQDLAFAGRLIMDLGVLGGAITMARGWEIGRHHEEARTVNNSWVYYRTFTVGALTAGVSVMVGEILAWSSNRTEADAARALMAPQEHTTTTSTADEAPGAPAAAKP